MSCTKRRTHILRAKSVDLVHDNSGFCKTSHLCVLKSLKCHGAQTPCAFNKAQAFKTGNEYQTKSYSYTIDELQQFKSTV
eukprot:4892887-Pleurochrysis_carterae.AAC.1